MSAPSAALVSSPRTTSSSVPPPVFWKKLIRHLLIPLFLAAGMGLAYLGAFHEPAPQNLSIAIVGDSAETQIFAQSIQNEATAELDVRTVSDAATARQMITDRDIVAAYESGADGATLFVSSAASATTASIAQKIFLPIAYSQNLPVKVDDVVPTGAHDASGQGLFFLLVALSVGGYASAIAIAGSTATVRLRWRLAIAVVWAAVISGIGILIAGPIYHVIEHNQLGLWLLSWLYVSTIILIGLGLHPLLRRWTTPTLTLMFVMLNFTSSNGIFTANTVPSFFAGIGTFWNGAAWIDAAQVLTYFPGQDLWVDGLKLGLWVVAGLGLTLLTHRWSMRRTRLANENVRVSELEKVIAA